MITVADVMAHVAVQIGSPLSGWLEAKVRTAVMNAWARLYTMHEWAYHHRTSSVVVSAGQSTGTVDFTESTRRVVLTGATFPSDITGYYLRLRNNWYPIYRRISSTEVELYTNQHPASDLDDYEYFLQKMRIPLPSDVGDIVQMIETTQNLQMMRLSLLEAHQVSEGYAWSPVLPTTYALVGDTINPQRWHLWIPVQQTQDTTLQYVYKMRRPPNVLAREDRGLVSITGGVATFSEDVVGSLWDSASVLLRLSSDDRSVPTGPFGDLAGADIRYNRDCYEVRVLERLTANTCRISDTSLTLTDVQYVASSLIDTGDATMEVLVARLAEDEYGAKLVGNHMENIVSKNRLAAAFHEAKTADARHVRNKGPAAQWYGLRLRDLGYTSPAS